MSVAIVCMVNHTAVRQLNEGGHVAGHNITQIISDEDRRYGNESSINSVTAFEVQTPRCSHQNNDDNGDDDGMQKVCCENVPK